MHGGSSKTAKAAAARRQELAKVEAEVKTALATESYVGVLNPLQLVSQITVEAVAMKDALAPMVNALGDRIRYSAPGSGTEQLRAEVLLYERALDRCAKFADMLVRSGFENRKLLLEEHLARATGELIGRFLDDLMDSLRDALIAAGADALEPTFPAVWKDAIGRLFPAAFRALGTEGGSAG